MFEPFLRLDERTGDTRGVGLGLSIAQSVAVAHAGGIELRAHPAGGLSVLLRLPGPHENRAAIAIGPGTEVG